MVKLEEDERILWSGTPLKMPYLFGAYIVASVGVLLSLGALYVALVYKVNQFFFFAPLLFGILVVFMPFLRYWDWKTTQYVVTNQRVFFDTMIGYDVVKAEDIQDVYVKAGLLDKLHGTSKVFVTYRGFQPTTKYWKPLGTVVVRQGYPSFNSIKNAEEVKELILGIKAQKQLQRFQWINRHGVSGTQRRMKSELNLRFGYPY